MQLFFSMTPYKSLFLRNSIAKQDLNLQVVQIENLPEVGFVQLKIYRDLDQICQLLPVVRLLRSHRILMEGQSMSLLLFQCPVINVVKQNVGEVCSLLPVLI